jgi:hypothetical protein
MKRPEFFEDLDKSLQGIDVEKLRAEEAERRRVEYEQRRVEPRANVAIDIVSQTTSLVAPSVIYWPYESRR